MTAWKCLRIALIASLAMGLVACGDDDDGGTDAGTDAMDMDTGGDDAGETNSIVDIAAANPDFSLLVEAATRAGLVETLSEVGGQTFTVFAPTNQAFMDSGITSLDGFTDEELAGILTYHALLGTVMSGDIEAGPTTTVSTFTLFLATEGGVTINGGNTITGGANVAMGRHRSRQRRDPHHRPGASSAEHPAGGNVRRLDRTACCGRWRVGSSRRHLGCRSSLG